MTPKHLEEVKPRDIKVGKLLLPFLGSQLQNAEREIVAGGLITVLQKENHWGRVYFNLSENNEFLISLSKSAVFQMNPAGTLEVLPQMIEEGLLKFSDSGDRYGHYEGHYEATAKLISLLSNFVDM